MSASSSAMIVRPLCKPSASNRVLIRTAPWWASVSAMGMTLNYLVAEALAKLDELASGRPGDRGCRRCRWCARPRMRCSNCLRFSFSFRCRADARAIERAALAVLSLLTQSILI